MEYSDLYNSIAILMLLICMYIQHREIIDLYKEVFKLKQQKENKDGAINNGDN